MGVKVEEVDYLASHDTETHRYCGSCNKLYPLREFYKDGKDNHGNVRYRRDCKSCYKKTRIYEDRAKAVIAKKKNGGK